MNQNTQWKKNMFASKTWKILSVSALAMMISACGGDDDEEEVVGDPVNLTVTVTGSGQIKTKSNTIRCGAGGSDCTQTYMEVDSEEFTAVPQSGHYFAGWQAAECAGVDAVCTLKISSALTGATDTAYTLKATFKPIAASAAATYTHNVLGQRTSKTVGGVTTYFIYDTAGNLIQELDSTGKPVIETVYLENQAVARIEKSGTTTATRYVHNDHLGAPVMMTNQERKVTWEIETTPFGEPYALYEAGIAQNSRFPGQYWDAETATSENVMRTYDPSTGRYLQVDSLGLFDGTNPYAYVHGSPLNKIDPQGEFVWIAAGVIIGAGLDLVTQLAVSGWDVDCVSWSQVGAAGALGAIGGGSFSGAFNLTKGSMKASNALRRYRTLHKVPRTHDVHHWAIEKGSRIGKRLPGSIVNHPANLNSIPRGIHQRIHGNHPRLSQYDPVRRWWHETPSWAKAGQGAIGGGLIGDLSTAGSCGCKN